MRRGFRWVTTFAICTAPAVAADAPPAQIPPAATVIGQPRVAATIVHAPGVNAVAVSPDGLTIATAGADGTTRLWDAARPKAPLVLRGHEGAVTGVAFLRGRKLVVTGGVDGTVRLWDAASGRPILDLRGHTREVRAIAVSADGRRIASGSADKTICLWDVADERAAEDGAAPDAAPGAAPASLLRQIRPYQYKAGHNPQEGIVECLALSPDGTVLVSGHRVFDFTAHVWDANTGVEIARLEEQVNHVAKVVFSPDGATLATVSTRGRAINLWETATWKLRRSLPVGRQEWHFPAAFSPDGWRLASSAGSAMAVWDLSSGKPVTSSAGSHRGRIVGVAYTPDGSRAVSGGQEGMAVVWNLGSPARRAAEPPAEALTRTRLEQLWADLAVEDAGKSYVAIWALAAAPDQAVPFIAQRLQPGEPVDEAQVRRWVRELDDESFVVRERATRQLAELGDGAEPFLRQAMASRPSVEVAQRLEVLLSSIEAPTLDADAVRALRSLEVLERAATPEARTALEELTTGVTGSKLRRRARAAVARLSERERGRNAGR